MLLLAGAAVLGLGVADRRTGSKVRYHAFALERVRRFRSVVTELSQRDYPFQHSITALDLLNESFKELEGQLVQAQKASDATRQTLAQRTLEEIYVKLPVLGLIERSADVIGPVEFHGPFCRIIRSVLGSGAKLILAADWDYSPYTYIYPDLFPGHQFVIVALPYSEVGQVLGLPLAGHELGHNVWSSETLVNQFAGDVARVITELIDGQFKSLYESSTGSSVKPSDDGDLFGGSPPWHDALRLSLKQCEELFCDFFGIALFRGSYLSAFEYLTAPWSFERMPEYPSMADRLAAQAQCATLLGVSIPDYYSVPGITSHTEGDVLLQIADVATKRQIPKLIEQARAIVESRLPQQNNVDEIARIEKCFRDGYPATRTKSIADILNAAWSGASFDVSDAETLPLINELALKTLEVLEIETIQREAETCSTQAKLPS